MKYCFLFSLSLIIFLYRKSIAVIELYNQIIFLNNWNTFLAEPSNFGLSFPRHKHYCMIYFSFLKI